VEEPQTTKWSWDHVSKNRIHSFRVNQVSEWNSFQRIV
jgi:hypothetical protein